MTPFQRIARLASRQHGCFTSRQANELGWSERALRTGVANGAIERLEPGVYRFSGHPTSWLGDVMSACLAEDGLASHRTAAALWELDGFPRRTIEVVTLRWSRRPNDSVRVHESLDLRPEDRAERCGIPCESVERLLIGLGAVVPRVRVEQALDDALNRGLTTPERVRDRFVQVARRGRGGCGVLRPLLEVRLGQRGPRPGEFGRRVGRIIAGAGLPAPTVEHEVRDAAGRFMGRVDLAYPERRLFIELDSQAWHVGRQRRQRDLTRQNGLVLNRWCPLRFTWEDVTGCPELVAREIEAALALPVPVPEPA